MTGGDILIACLKAQGIDSIVGMPGNQNITIYDALLRDGGIAHYLIRNEQGATLIANGYARASGRVGAALTVPGPGATNASTGIIDAHTDCVPVLLITGGTEIKYDGRDRSKCFHGLDQAAFFAPITRYFARPTSVADIPREIEAAFRALRAPRPGPVVLELPVDVAAAEGAPDIPDYIEGDRPVPDTEAIRRAAQMLGKASRPVLLAGGNVISAEASKELRALAEKLNAPVVHTRLGKGAFPDGHPLYVGHCTAKFGRAVLEKSDCLLSAGCRFTQIDSRGWSHPLPSPHIQLDPDVREIGREYPTDLGIFGHVKDSLGRLAEAAPVPRTAWNGLLQRLRQEITAHRPPVPILSAIRRHLDDDAIVSVDVTSVGYRAFDEFPIYHPRTFMYPCHSVTLGFAVPAAIGAKMACPDRQTVAISGDGGFQMTAYELATAAEHGLSLVSVVSNDGSLSAIRGAQAQAFDGRVIDTDMQTPHLADMARSLGARGIRVEDPDRFEAVFADSLGLDGLTVIEVMMQERRDALIRQVPWLNPD